ncbi:MAG: class I SAM-dependent methyltransferase [Gammaproteobacteria bacterium]|nr:MAG: class I SAM-dependent methyltransferase [Gammaproteobacteria bacterium]
MNDQSRKVFERIYGSAATPKELPWHRDEPPPLLVKALAARQGAGNALDIGCGAGTYSMYMARRGYKVTGIDFMPQAVEMLRKQAAAASLDVTAIQGDITTWETPEHFDVVLDVGCLHSIGQPRHAVYKKQLLRWLVPGGDFVLTHLGRRGWWDRWPVGPNRIGHDTIAALFQPDLKLKAYEPELLTGMPMFMGRSALVGRYWFQRVN